MGMAMNQAATAAACQCGAYRGGVGVHDGGGFFQHGFGAAAAQGLNFGKAFRKRAGKKTSLPLRGAHHAAELLIGDIVGTNCVAMHQQRRRIANADFYRFVQELNSGGGGKDFTEQEIAIAGDEVNWRTPIRQIAQESAHLGIEGIGQIVIADPVFEQVAEDEQRSDTAGRGIRQKGGETLGEVRPFLAQVQIGNEAGSSGYVQHGTALALQIFSARSMTTSSLGTFW